MIQFNEFFNNYPAYISSYNAWCFVGSEYPAFFFTNFRSFFEKKQEVRWNSLSCESISLDELEHILGMSFLGEQQIYFLGDLNKCSTSLVSYCQNYQGPHLIIYCCSQTTHQPTTLQIPLPSTLNAEMYALLSEQFVSLPKDVQFFNEVSRSIKNIDLDTACILMHYQQLVGKRYQEFTQKWLPNILPANTSLFSLATHFFARDKEAFLVGWQAISPQYPEEFWVSYWSEQLWQASLFINNATTMGPEKAAKMSNRLPFSFVQRDWKKYSSKRLAKSHEELLTIDIQLKNGASFKQIETWLLKWIHQ